MKDRQPHEVGRCDALPLAALECLSNDRSIVALFPPLKVVSGNLALARVGDIDNHTLFVNSCLHLANDMRYTPSFLSHLLAFACSEVLCGIQPATP